MESACKDSSGRVYKKFILLLLIQPAQTVVIAKRSEAIWIQHKTG